MLKPIYSTISLVLFSASHSLYADTVVKLNTPDGSTANTLSIHSGMVKMPAPSGDMRMVMDTNSRQTYMIDDGKKQYTTVNTETIKKTADLMGLMREQMLAQLKNMPAEQRKMLEDNMGINLESPSIPKVTMKASGKKKQVSGIECEVNDILSDGKKTMEACVATVKASGMSQNDYATMQKMFEMFSQLTKQSAKMGGPAVSNSMANLPDFNGVPMEVKDLGNGQVTTISSIDNKVHLKDADFKPGSDYKQFDLMQEMQKQMGRMSPPK